LGRSAAPPPGPDELTPLRVSSPSSEFLVWRQCSPKPHESCRWETLDGRWVAIALGDGLDLGRAVVTNWSGARVLVDSFEDALELAGSWRLS
jgi:hypothetical protein